MHAEALLGAHAVPAVQGAFMAALHAQGLPFSGMQAAVRQYASEMGSVRRLLWDLTLPIISGAMR